MARYHDRMDDMLAAPDPKDLCVTTGGHNSKAAVVGGR